MAIAALAVETRTLERRVLFAELAVIDDCIKKHSLHDRISNFVYDWLTRFRYELKSSDDRDTLIDKYARELKITLIDPIQGSILEEISYLGSDGVTYGEKALFCTLSAQSIENRGRSPAFPQEKKHFFAVRHLVAETSIRFLKKVEGNIPTPPSIESLYQNLLIEKRLPTILKDKEHATFLDDLDHLKDALETEGNDTMTKNIRLCYQRLIEDLSSTENFSEIRRDFLLTIQKIFCDAHKGSALEKTSFLGSDGHAYGKRALYVYLEHRNIDKMRSSPKHPDAEDIFTIKRYPLAEAVFSLLKKHDAALAPLHDLSKEYKTLKRSGLPRLPLTEEISIEEEKGYIERSLHQSEARTSNASFEHTPRVRLQAELSIINDLLRLPFIDDLTTKIHQWHGRFILAIRHIEDPTEIIKEFIGSLLDIIGPSAEKKMYLGSDGKIYGKKQLYLSLKDLPPGFFAQKHPIADGVIAWLQRYGIDIKVSSDLVEEYQKMKSEGLPELPLDPVKARRQERIFNLRQARIKREEKEKEAKETAQKAAHDAAKAFIDEAMRGFHEEAEEIKAEEKVRIETAKAKHKDLEEELQAEETIWASKNAILRKRLDQLDERIDQIWIGTIEAERSISHLEASIAATTKAIEDKNERDEKTAWATIAKVAACAAVSYFTGMSISEPSGGGIMIGTTIPI